MAPRGQEHGSGAGESGSTVSQIKWWKAGQELSLQNDGVGWVPNFLPHS